jgi:hypothetical protein
MQMSFELLPNEILLDLFDYFDGIDLFHAFYGLNFRFNYLLDKQYRAFRFDFKSRSKRQFDMICQQQLPKIADRVISLNLSNDDDTPKQVDLFISYIPSIDQFIHLRSLSLSMLHVYTTIMKIIDQCHQLSGLIHLEFNSCYFSHNRQYFQSIINNIWSLPKLIYCKIHMYAVRRLRFCMPTQISTSFKRLALIRCPLALDQIAELYQYTPNLKHLSITVKNFADDYQPILLPTLISLQISVSYINGISKIVLLLQNMPNLRCLDINIVSNIIDGYQWKYIITNYLPKLEKFQFRMNHTLDFVDARQEHVDRLIDSFRSSFWIDEHRWFVRCFVVQTYVYLCTISNPLPYIGASLPDSFISTYPDDNLQQFCNSITEIHDGGFFDTPIPSNIHLSNIKRLEIKFPINDQFWSIVPILNQLHSLTVYLTADTCQSQVKALLDRAPHLSELTIRNIGFSPLQMSSFQYTNISVRQLDIQNGSHYFNEDESMALARSPLGIQCQVLTTLVRNRESILTLIQNMINLRFLTIACEELLHSNRLKTETDDLPHKEYIVPEKEIIQWLKERLPPTYTIDKYSYSTSKIQIWM